LDFNAYDEILAGKPDAGNPHVRFDEGEQRDWRKPPVALYSTGYNFAHSLWADDLAPMLQPILADSKLPSIAAAVVIGDKIESTRATGVRKSG
jgi:hypothetical protein